MIDKSITLGELDTLCQRYIRGLDNIAQAAKEQADIEQSMVKLFKECNSITYFKTAMGDRLEVVGEHLVVTKGNGRN